MNSRRIAAGTQLRGVLWRELKEWPVVLGSVSIVCQSRSLRLFCPSFYEYHSSIQAEEALESFYCVFRTLSEDRALTRLSIEELTVSTDWVVVGA